MYAMRSYEFARVQAARPALSRDERGLVPARVRYSGQRPGRRIWVEFDGAFRRRAGLCERLLYRPQRQRLRAVSIRPHGLSGLRRRRTTSSLRVDASFGDGWFYEGAGIYRHVWLTKTDALHLGKWESYVRAEVNGNSATLDARHRGRRTKASRPRIAKVSWQILDAAGKTVATAEAPAQSIAVDGSATFTATAKLANPALWSVDEPNLYSAIVTVESGRQGARCGAGELRRAHGEVRLPTRASS